MPRHAKTAPLVRAVCEATQIHYWVNRPLNYSLHALERIKERGLPMLNYLPPNARLADVQRPLDDRSQRTLVFKVMSNGRSEVIEPFFLVLTEQGIVVTAWRHNPEMAKQRPLKMRHLLECQVPPEYRALTGTMRRSPAALGMFIPKLEPTRCRRYRTDKYPRRAGRPERHGTKMEARLLHTARKKPLLKARRIQAQQNDTTTLLPKRASACASGDCKSAVSDALPRSDPRFDFTPSVVELTVL